MALYAQYEKTAMDIAHHAAKKEKNQANRQCQMENLDNAHMEGRIQVMRTEMQ